VSAELSLPLSSSVARALPFPLSSFDDVEGSELDGSVEDDDGEGGGGSDGKGGGRSYPTTHNLIGNILSASCVSCLWISEKERRLWSTEKKEE
jgi:hypothetical protein